MPNVLRRTLSARSSASLPAYTATDSSATTAPPPPFSYSDFPSVYRVGQYSTLFVTVDEVKAHLKLLAAFHLLRKRVESFEGGQWDGIDPKARWALFVHVAVERFEKYLVMLERRMPEDSGVPPLDVILVFHSYLLNPARFAEDSQRMVQLIRLNKDQLFGRMAASINSSTFEQETPDWAEADWEQRTSTYYNPFIHFETTKGYELRFPGSTESILVPWFTPEGTGYAQQGVKVKVPNGQTWTHESLGVYKLYRDIWDVRVEPKLHALSGTVLTTYEPAHLPSASKRAQAVNSRLRDSMPVDMMNSAEDLGRMLGYKRSSAKALLTLALEKPAGVERILSCYTRGERFSLELANAVLRQGTFIHKMHSLGWLEPGRFEGDVTLLHRCIARYHAFQDLLASKDSLFCVPTLDIDLAWHTHMLKGNYALDVVAHIKRFVDHDDKVEEGTLSVAFDKTAQEWQARYGVPYSTCGCPLPSTPPLSRLSRVFTRSTSTPHYPPTLLSASPPPSSSSSSSPPSTLPSHPAEETHPSEHNSVVLPSSQAAQLQRRARQTEMEQRRRKQEREWEKERAKREKETRGGGTVAGKEEEEKEWRETRNAHEVAFFAPMALVPVFDAAGYVLPPGGNCCAYDVNQAVGSGRNGGCGGGGSGACVTIGSTSCDSSAACASSGGDVGGSGGGGGGGGGDGGGSAGCGSCGGGGD